MKSRSKKAMKVVLNKLKKALKALGTKALETNRGKEKKKELTEKTIEEIKATKKLQELNDRLNSLKDKLKEQIEKK